MKKITKKICEGAASILEIKLSEIEKKVAKKNTDISQLTIPYLNTLNLLKEYLPDGKIKILNSKYEDAISKYWGFNKK